MKKTIIALTMLMSIAGTTTTMASTAQSKDRCPATEICLDHKGRHNVRICKCNKCKEIRYRKAHNAGPCHRNDCRCHRPVVRPVAPPPAPHHNMGPQRPAPRPAAAGVHRR